MCQARGSHILDECLEEDLAKINDKNGKWRGKFSSILSCCGHKIYHKTIVVQNNYSGAVFEWFSSVSLPNKYKNNKKRNRYYNKDKICFYFIPEVEKFWKNHKN